MRSALSTLLAVISFAAVSLAAEVKPPAGVLAEYVQALKLGNRAVFVSACQLDEHSKAMLIFRAGSATGDFFVITSTSEIIVATAQGQVTVESGTFLLRWINDQHDVAKQLVTNLSAWPFYLVDTTKLDTLYTDSAYGTC